jgi:outer membrane protein OmpA-like peptidoglycan-associated protein
MAYKSTIAFVSALLIGVAAAPGARAGDPSVDQIISSLKPTAGSLKKSNTRGIRAMAPTPDAPAASGSPHAEHHASTSGSLDLTVDFATGSADLTPAARQTLERLGKALSSPALASYKFRIEGHTDTVGTRDDNQKLSQARAEKVADFLEQGFAVAPDRLETVGMGEDGLLVQTPDQTNEPRNRRVHVVNLGKA